MPEKFLQKLIVAAVEGVLAAHWGELQIDATGGRDCFDTKDRSYAPRCEPAVTADRCWPATASCILGQIDPRADSVAGHANA